jgi:hypothetical protein
MRRRTSFFAYVDHALAVPHAPLVACDVDIVAIATTRRSAMSTPRLVQEYGRELVLGEVRGSTRTDAICIPPSDDVRRRPRGPPIDEDGVPPPSISKRISNWMQYPTQSPTPHDGSAEIESFPFVDVVRSIHHGVVRVRAFRFQYFHGPDVDVMSLRMRMDVVHRSTFE